MPVSDVPDPKIAPHHDRHSHSSAKWILFRCAHAVCINMCKCRETHQLFLVPPPCLFSRAPLSYQQNPLSRRSLPWGILLSRPQEVPVR